MSQHRGFKLIVVCQACQTKNSAYYHLLCKTNCGKCREPLLKPDKPQGVVYLLRAGHYYKIGKAVDFKKRLGQIKLHLPFAVETIHFIQAFDPARVERYWHQRFANKRVNGEWFVLTDEEAAEFRQKTTM